MKKPPMKAPARPRIAKQPMSLENMGPGVPAQTAPIAIEPMAAKSHARQAAHQAAVPNTPPAKPGNC